MDSFISMDKQKNWVLKKDFASVREYNSWKAKNWREKHKKPKIEKVLTEKQNYSKNWYLENRDFILEKYQNKKKGIYTGYIHTWIPISLEDRNFVLNFKPEDYPGYKTALQNLIYCVNS